MEVAHRVVHGLGSVLSIYPGFTVLVKTNLFAGKENVKSGNRLTQFDNLHVT